MPIDNTTLGGVTSKTGQRLITFTLQVKDAFNSRVLTPWPKHSIAKRIASAVKKSLVSGLIYFKERDKLATLYKPRQVSMEGEANLVWLGTTSNDPMRVQAKTISQDVLGNVLVIVSKHKVPAEFEHGIDINKDEPLLKQHFYNGSNELIDNDTKVAVRVSVGLPAPYEALIKTGTVGTDTFTSLDASDGTGKMAFWADCIRQYDSNIQSILLGDQALRKYLPTRPTTGHDYVNSPFISPTEPDEDDTELQEEVETLQEECIQLLKSLLSNGGTNDDVSTKVPAVVDTATKQIESEEASKPTYTEADYLAARTKAFGIRYNEETDKLVLPEFSQFYGAVKDATSKTAQRDLTESSLQSIEATMSDSTHYAARSVDPSKPDTITLAHIGQCKWSSDPNQSLEAGSSGKGVVLTMLLPDSLATAKTKADKQDEHDAEEAVGEHASKRTKIDTSFTTITELNSSSTLVSTFANGLMLSYFYYKFDLDNPSEMPSFAFVMTTFAALITNKDAKGWIKNNPGEKRQKYLYYVFNQAMSCSVALARASKNVLVITNILQAMQSTDPQQRADAISRIPRDDYRLCHQILRDTRSTIQQIHLNSRDVPTTELYNSSSFKKRAEEKERKKLLQSIAVQASTPRGGGDDKGRKNSLTSLGGGPPTKRRKKDMGKKGFLECTEPNFSIPKECHNKDFTLCKSAIKNDHECPYGDRCKFDHCDFEDLNQGQQKAMVTHVDSTPSLSFVNIDAALLNKIRSM